MAPSKLTQGSDNPSCRHRVRGERETCVREQVHNQHSSGIPEVQGPKVDLQVQELRWRQKGRGLGSPQTALQCGGPPHFYRTHRTHRTHMPGFCRKLQSM